MLVEEVDSKVCKNNKKKTKELPRWKKNPLFYDKSGILGVVGASPVVVEGPLIIVNATNSIGYLILGS